MESLYAGLCTEVLQWIHFSGCKFFLPPSKSTVLNTLQIPKAFEGGSNAFLSLLWTSAVTGYGSIKDHIYILRPPPPLYPCSAGCSWYNTHCPVSHYRFSAGLRLALPCSFC